MPTSPPRLCNGCRRLVRGRCPRCTPDSRRQHDQRRPSSSERGYGWRWRTSTRLEFLKLNPLCVVCSAAGGVHRLAEVPDHWPKTRAQLVAEGVADPDAFERLRPLCLHHHATIGEKFDHRG